MRRLLLVMEQWWSEGRLSEMFGGLELNKRLTADEGTSLFAAQAPKVGNPPPIKNANLLKYNKRQNQNSQKKAGTVDSRCPSKLECLSKMREQCTPGSNVCGPCIYLSEETKTGHCIFKVASRTKFTGPDSMIDIIQEYRLTKGHRIISTDIASATTANTAASAQATSQEMKPPNFDNATPTRGPSPAAATFAPQLKVKNMGRRRKSEMNQSMSLALTVICSLTAVSGLLVAALCWYRLQKEVRLAQEMAYQGKHHHPCKRSAAHMSHYVQQYSSQKKQFKAQECPQKKPCQQLSTDSEADIDEYAIYECPGLAPTGEMEVHNPLFDPSRTKQ